MKFDPKAPDSLLDLQKWFCGIAARPLRDLGEYRIPVYDKAVEDSIEERISAGPQLSSSQRMGIYNQQYWFRLFVILQEAYPALMRLFGPEDFNESIAEPYLLKYPPDHWAMDLLGRKLPRWVEEEYWEEDRSLVLSTAKIDEAYQRLGAAPVFPVPDRFDFAEEKLYLQPGAILLEMEGGYFPFREKLIEQEPEHWYENDFPQIEPFPKKPYILFMHRGKVQLEEVSQAQSALLQAFAKGSRIEDACALLGNAIESEEEERICDWFETWVKRKWITSAACS